MKGKIEINIWKSDCHVNFEALRKTLIEIAILRMMDPLRNELVLCSSANDMAIGAILMQENRTIAYEFKKLNNVKLNYPVHKKWLLAIIHASKV